MKIDIEKIARLAKLKIEPDKRGMFEIQMEQIVAMVENLPEMSERYVGVDPENPMRLREDEVRPSMRRDELLQNAPKVQAGCVVVPRTVE